MRYNQDSRLLSRPTYSYQARRQRQIWQAPIPWQGSRGTYTAIAMLPNGAFEVLVTTGARARWLPVEAAIREQEVKEWIRRCREVAPR